MKIVAVFNCDSWLMSSFGGNKLRNSWSFFHPDIPIVWYNENYTNRIILQNPGFELTSFMPIIMKEVKETYKADLVIKLDADSIVLSRLDEILEGDYEIAGCRNDGDHAKGDESNNRPISIKNLSRELYMSCGCIATTSDQFLDDWYNLNKDTIEKYGSLYPHIPMAEQGSYNIIYHSGKYKTKILDEINGNLHYGASANMPSPNKRKIPKHIIKEYGCSIWQSWKDIKYKNGKFWLYGKNVKIIHQAGGGNPLTCKKLQWDMFNPQVVFKLKEITQCNE